MSEFDPLINRGARESFYHRAIRPSLAEFIGTTVFVFIGCMAVQTQNVGSIALAHGLAIALLITGLGKISGGHFNPAVTLGVTISGGNPIVVSIFYFLAQILGGMVGAAFALAVLPESVYKGITGGAHTLGHGVYPGWAILAEGILTFLLVFTVLMTAVDEEKSNLAPLAIGFAVAVDIIAGAMTTGASMNPARSFGPAVAYSKYGDVNVWKHHYVYWVGPTAGAIAAAVIYRYKVWEVFHHFHVPRISDLPHWRNILLSEDLKPRICVFACDEAHCISEWGEDFRPAYKEVLCLRSIIEAPVLAITGTCDEKVKKDIFSYLALTDEVSIIAVVPDRPNIYLDIRESKQNHETDLQWMVDYLSAEKTNAKKMIVYCRFLFASGNRRFYAER